MTAAIIGTNISYIILAFFPPILWLLFYLREDCHPEPKLLLLLTFIGGMIAAIPAIIAECTFMEIVGGSCKEGITVTINPLFFFLGIALIEEYIKYLPIKLAILKRRDFDEPVDAMIYLMTSAMGFASLENVLFLFPLFQQNLLSGFEIGVNRFLGANLLHVLSSGIVGYFLARAFFSPHRHHFVGLGILVATILHALFNYFILLRGPESQTAPYIILLLTTMAVVVFVDFESLRGSPPKSDVINNP